jgi:hypothetical protein
MRTNCNTLTDVEPRGGEWQPALLTGYFAGAAFAAKMAQEHHLPWPRCWFREFTGLPCPTCGATHSLLAFARFDPGSAFRYNPLFSLACVGVVIWLFVAVLDRLFGFGIVNRVCDVGKRWPVGKIAIGLIVLNWLYLCVYLPR